MIKEKMSFLETADIETASDDYAARFTGVAGEFFLNRQKAIFLELLKDLPGASILDVGGGHGQLAEPLIGHGFSVTVTGSDESCRTRLDRYLKPGTFSYHTCDSLALPFADCSFDVVMSFRLLPHVTKWQELIAELCRVAAKCVILDYPDRRSTNILYELLFGIKKKMEGNTRPFTLFSRNEIAKAVGNNGFCKPKFVPEFFLPMVVHRKLKNKNISRFTENCCSLCGLTSFLGSPIVFRSDRITPPHHGATNSSNATY
jgi:ubiquinone/menaquinone biosynthesis C-methylase UbiE